MRNRSLFAILCALMLAGGASAEAAKKKAAPVKKTAKAGKTKPKAAPKADTRAVSELMGKFKWGMSKDEVLGVLGKQFDERAAEKVKATTDVYAQDNFRKAATEEKNRIAKTFVQFEGKKTGWDVSIIDKEFDHKDDESMLYMWENDANTKKDQKRFFFFVDGKLWKMFIAFNSDMFEGKTFADFAGIMQTRYGKSAEDTADGVHYIFWRAPGYYLRAIDLTQFYGNFCIAISDDKIENTIVARRTERNPKPEKTNVMMDTMTEGNGKNSKDESKPSLEDPNSDVVDRMTGNGGK